MVLRFQTVLLNRRGDNMKPLAVLGIVGEFHPAYSISTVIRSQLLGFQVLGVPVVSINTQGGSHPPEFTGELRYIPDLPMQDWLGGAPVDSYWYEEASKLIAPLVESLKGIEVVLVNDLIMQGWYMQYRWALMEAAKRLPELRVFHLIHSAPGEHKELPDPRNCMYEVLDNESIIYNNSSDLPLVMNRYATDRVYAVHNPLHLPDFFELPEKVAKLYYDMKFEEADVITIYPTRLDDGKQLDKWLGMIAGFKQIGISVRGIIVNSFSNSYRHTHTMVQLKEQAERDGLVLNRDFCFTSEMPGAEVCFTRQEISALNRLANVFIQASASETCSLIMLEAMASRQLLVLNDDLACNRYKELAGLNAIRGRFGGLTRKTEYTPNYQSYCRDLAKQVMDALMLSREQYGFLQVLKKHSLTTYASDLMTIMFGVVANAPVKTRSVIDIPNWSFPSVDSIPHNEATEKPILASGRVPLRVVDPSLG